MAHPPTQLRFDSLATPQSPSAIPGSGLAKSRVLRLVLVRVAAIQASGGNLIRDTISRLSQPRETIRPRAELVRQDNLMARTADQPGRSVSPEDPHSSAVPTDKSLENPP
jgi:hypothetical protein